MALVRFRHPGPSLDAFRDVSDLQGDMNRLFDSFFGRPNEVAGGERERVWAPAVDMYEMEDEVVVVVDLPGLNQKDIHLSISGDMLTIRGERPWNPLAEERGYQRGERWFGQFQRMLPLPMPVHSDQVKAAYREGVLTVTLPKTEAVKPKEIKIESQ